MLTDLLSKKPQEITRMDVKSLIEKIRSGVLSIEFLNSAEEIVATGSGFMVDGYLITNHHVFMGPDGCSVIIATHPTIDPKSRIKTRIGADEFRASLLRGSDKNNYDYAVLDLPVLREVKLYNFDLCFTQDYGLGDPIIVLGYPFGARTLTAHFGYISSRFESGVADVIQVDASVNQSNSGGPLVCAITGKVLGVVTRKATGITSAMESLKSVINNNVKILSPMAGMMYQAGVDPIGALIHSNLQVQTLCREIERSANVGIGYAFAVDTLKYEVESLS